jgi:copper(I)-binding protein
MNKPLGIAYLLLFVSLFLCPPAFVNAESPVVVHDAWVMEAPPGMKVMAAYRKIENSSANDHLLINVSSPQFQKVEMHRTVMESGIARMIHQENMKIERGKTLEFVPGGSHLMLIGPDSQPGKGDKVEIVLQFKDGSKITVVAPVQRYKGKNYSKHGQKNLKTMQKD